MVGVDSVDDQSDCCTLFQARTVLGYTGLRCSILRAMSELSALCSLAFKLLFDSSSL